MDTDIQAGLKGYELTRKARCAPSYNGHLSRVRNLANYPESITEHFDAVTPGMSTASWAMRWIASLPNVKGCPKVACLIWTQVKDNLKTYQDFRPLSKEEYQAVDQVVKELNSRAKNGCTGCEYCLPCPAGVDIPRNFFHLEWLWHI